jgi:phosphoglycolate phosphatase-like HAD superfamily hydrolase
MIYLFDIDGTLVATHGAGRRAFEHALLEVCGMKDGLAEVELDGKTDSLILDESFAAVGRRRADLEERRAVFAAYLRRLPIELEAARYEIFPGVVRALDHLEARDAVLGLATGNLEDGARHKLERGDLWRRFSFGGFGSDAHARADLVRVALARARLHPAHGRSSGEAWVVGDTPLDVAAAHAAGARAIAVATGRYDVDALARAGADLVVPTLDEWLDHVARPSA